MTKDRALQVLGLNKRFTQDEARANYRKLARKYHPDIAGVAFNAKFAEINEAYELISNLGDSVGCALTHSTIFKVVRN